MRSQHKLYFIVFKEKFNSIWAKLDNIACTVGISDKVRLDAELLITIGRITPQNVHD